MPGYYIWINGFPGVGKLTVAKALYAMLPGSRLVDNHSLIDQVPVPRDHPEYNDIRARIRDDLLAAVAHPASDEESECGSREEQLAKTLIFTDCFDNGKTGSTWSRHHQTTAARANRPFLPIYLVCERGENLRRATIPERKEAGGKLTDAAVVADFLDTCTLFRFEGLGVEVDTTTRAPEETAGLILEAMEGHKRAEGEEKKGIEGE